MKLVIAICGASGVQYGISLLQILKKQQVETHLVISDWGKHVIKEETSFDIKEIEALADFVYDFRDMGAAISSSSFLVDGMIICPATVATISRIATADSSNLITRAADNMLKMKKPLTIAFRETPLSAPCLKNLYDLAIAGAIIIPLAPGFYHKPQNIDDMINFMVGKILDTMNIQNQEYKRWK